MRKTTIISFLAPVFLLAGCGGSPIATVSGCSGCDLFFATTQSSTLVSGRNTRTLGWQVSATAPGPAESNGIVAALIFPNPFVYVSDPVANSIRAYQISPTDGSLLSTSLKQYPLAGPSGSPQQLWLAGSFLYAADSGGWVFGFTVDASGSLAPMPGSPFPVAVGASHLCTLADRLYVASASGTNGSISAFSIAAATGSLTPAPGMPFPMSLDSAPAGLLCSLDKLYVTLPSQSLIAAFSPQADGSLIPVPGSPFAAGRGVASLAQILNNIYAENNLDQTVSSYAQQISGALVPVVGSPYPAPAATGELEVIDSALFVPRSSGFLVFQPNFSTGTLTLASGLLSSLGFTPLSVVELQLPVFDPPGPPR